MLAVMPTPGQPVSEYTDFELAGDKHFVQN